MNDCEGGVICPQNIIIEPQSGQWRWIDLAMSILLKASRHKFHIFVLFKVHEILGVVYFDIAIRLHRIFSCDTLTGFSWCVNGAHLLVPNPKILLRFKISLFYRSWANFTAM